MTLSMSPTERDVRHSSDRARRRAAHRRHAVIAGLLALTVAAVTAAGIAVQNAAGTSRHQAIALSRQFAAGSLAIDPIGPLTAWRPAIAAWRDSPAGRPGLIRTTLLAERQASGILLVSSSAVNGVAFSPDGKLLASAYGDGAVRLWDLATGQLYGPVLGAVSSSDVQGAVNGVAFSPDGKLLAGGDADGTIQLWNPATGQPIGSPLQAGSAVNAVAFSPSGSQLASGDADGTIQFWNPATGQPISSPQQAGSAVNAVAFSPKGKQVAGGDADGIVRLWNAPSGQSAGLDNDDWFIIVACVIAIAVSALTVAITANEIWLASRPQP